MPQKLALLAGSAGQKKKDIVAKAAVDAATD